MVNKKEIKVKKAKKAQGRQLVLIKLAKKVNKDPQLILTVHPAFAKLLNTGFPPTNWSEVEDHYGTYVKIPVWPDPVRQLLQGILNPNGCGLKSNSSYRLNDFIGGSYPYVGLLWTASLRAEPLSVHLARYTSLEEGKAIVAAYYRAALVLNRSALSPWEVTGTLVSKQEEVESV